MKTVWVLSLILPSIPTSEMIEGVSLIEKVLANKPDYQRLLDEWVAPCCIMPLLQSGKSYFGKSVYTLKEYKVLE
jgi:hypothetical protein